MALTSEQIWDLAHEVASELLRDPETITIVEIAEENDFGELTRDDIVAVARAIGKAEVTIP